MRITPESLASIMVLYRAPDSLALYGIPYRMRPGQEPRRIMDRFRNQWIWLGSPGWYGHMTKDEQTMVKGYLAGLQDQIPGNPHEWDTIENVHGC